MWGVIVALCAWECVRIKCKLKFMCVCVCQSWKYDDAQRDEVFIPCIKYKLKLSNIQKTLKVYLIYT